MSYTKGPWIWENSEDGFCLSPGVIITDFRDGTPWGDEIDRANARLIAAAPELLDAAEKALSVAEDWIHDQLDGTSMVEKALDELSSVRAAIAKAKGE